MTGKIVLGSRGSALARVQTSMVQAALRLAWRGIDVRTEIIKTRGDESAETSRPLEDPQAGRKGLFTAEIERALSKRRIDVAVHSAKDLPSDEPAELEICAVLPRAAVEDLLITKQPGGLSSLCAGGAIGTGSVRRKYQLLARRPDLSVVDLRGNVPTRLRKLTAQPWDGIILAQAGLERLGLDVSSGHLEFEGHVYFSETLPCGDFLPAGGQGVIALQVRRDDAATRQTAGSVNHAETFLCLRAEREFLRLLHGDCDSPVGVIANIDTGVMTMRAQVFEPPAALPISGEVSGRADAGNVPKLAALLIGQINGQ